MGRASSVLVALLVLVARPVLAVMVAPAAMVMPRMSMVVSVGAVVTRVWPVPVVRQPLVAVTAARAVTGSVP